MIVYNMINILTFCNPSYNTIGTTNRSLSLIKQLYILYNSLKKKWINIDYDFYVVYNKNIKWSEEDSNYIKRFSDINWIAVNEGDVLSHQWITRIPCFTHTLKRQGTHRLILDCDMIALNEPTFDLSCDLQAMYARDSTYSDAPKEALQYIINHLDLNINLDCYKTHKNAFVSYNLNPSIFPSNTFPHFNAGMVLLKEELCSKFGEIYKKWSTDYLLKSTVGKYHIGNTGIFSQYVYSLILVSLSDNFKPLHPGMNFLVKDISINKFGRENIGILHYAGVSNSSRQDIYNSQVLPLLEEFSE